MKEMYEAVGMIVWSAVLTTVVYLFIYYCVISPIADRLQALRPVFGG